MYVHPLVMFSNMNAVEQCLVNCIYTHIYTQGEHLYTHTNCYYTVHLSPISRPRRLIMYRGYNNIVRVHIYNILSMNTMIPCETMPLKFRFFIQAKKTMLMGEMTCT